MVALRELPSWDASEPPLNAHELSRVALVGGCRKRWLDSAVAQHPLVVRSLRACAATPEMCDLEFAWDRAIICNFEEGWAHVFYPGSRRRPSAGGLFLAGLRNLTGRFYPILGAALIGAAADLNGRAALVAAPDGGGKTTLVQGLPESRVLSDDHVVLRPRPGHGVMVHSTPFGTRTCGPVSLPLGALFLLNKAPRPAVRPTSMATAMSWLVDGPHSSWLACPVSVRSRAFNILVDICREVPLFELDAPIGFEDWDLLARHMA